MRGAGQVEQLVFHWLLSWISHQHGQSCVALRWRSDFCLPETDSPFAGARGSRTVTFKLTPPPASLTRPNSRLRSKHHSQHHRGSRGPCITIYTRIVAFFCRFKSRSYPTFDSCRLWYDLSRQRPCWSYGEPGCSLGAGAHFTVLASTIARAISAATPNAAERVDLDAVN